MALPDSMISGNTPKVFGQGMDGSQAQRPNTNVMLPEEKAVIRERRRIEALIKGYRNNPSAHDDSYVMQLEQYAAQYDIPFERASAGVMRNAGAATAGFLDSFLFDLVPDSWYSSDATSTARAWGKGIGLGTAAIFTGGTSLLGKGLTKVASTGLGKFTTAGAALAAKKMAAPTIAGYAGQGGMVGNLARGFTQSGQGQNIAKLATDDAILAATNLAKEGNKAAALEVVEGTGALTDDAAKLAMAESTGAVSKGVEAQVYAATKGLGVAAPTAQASGKVETVLNTIINTKGAGAKTKSAVEAVLKDKNKMKQLEDIIADPNNSIDDVIDAIKGILPKAVRGKLVKKSDIVQQLATLYGFGSTGG